jgi:hypothetical protein
MKFWNNIMSGLKARKGEFTGTSGNEANISKRVNNNQSVNISNPTSYRTYQNVGYGKLDENDIDVGLTSGRGAELASTAIKNARYDPEDDSLNITYTGCDKEYKFQAGGPDGVQEWVNAPSKGKITQEWRKTHRYPGY